MKKITNTTTAKKKKSNPVRDAVKTFEEEFYRDMFSFKMVPIVNGYLEKIALEWVEVTLKDETILTLDDYYFLKGLQEFSVNRWMKRCIELKEAHDYAKAIIANRREKGAIINKYNSNTILRCMPLYSEKWKDLEEWRATLSAKIALASGGNKNITIEVNPVERCEKVKDPKR